MAVMRGGTWRLASGEKSDKKRQGVAGTTLSHTDNRG